MRAAAGVELREYRVLATCERTQCPQQRRVGELELALLHTLAEQYPGAVQGVPCLGQEPGLTDARVACDQQQARPTLKRFAVRKLELRQLALTSHEAAAHQSSG